MHRRPDSHESRCAGTPADAMFPAVEDGTAMIQRTTDNAVPQDLRAVAPKIDQSGGLDPVVELSPPRQPALSVAAGMRTASTAGVVRAGAVMAVATVVSRVTGLVSKVAILAVIGAGLAGSAYSVANTLPNIVFELLIGGVLATVAIPLLTRAQRSDPDGGLEYTQRLLTLAVIGLLMATVIAVFVPRCSRSCI